MIRDAEGNFNHKMNSEAEALGKALFSTRFSLFKQIGLLRRKKIMIDFLDKIGFIEPKLGFKALTSQKLFKKSAKTVKTVSFHNIAFSHFGCLCCFSMFI